jgi:dienelactone hydrolase
VRIFKSVPIALACLFAAHMSFAATSDAVDFLVHDGYKHRYIVHVSSAYDPEIPVPLVLNFHDVFGKAETQRKLSGMNATADKYGFIVVYPEGIKGTWNAGQCCGFAEWQNLDDVGFVRELIETLQRKYSIDKQRIYATGFGDGAMLCYRLACELPDRFAAIGPVGGGMGGDGPLPSRPVAILHIHGVSLGGPAAGPRAAAASRRSRVPPSRQRPASPTTLCPRSTTPRSPPSSWVRWSSTARRCRTSPTGPGTRCRWRGRRCAAKVLVLRRLALVEVLRQFGGSSAAILQPQDFALDHKSGLGEVAGELKPSPDKGFIEIGLPLGHWSRGRDGPRRRVA